MDGLRFLFIFSSFFVLIFIYSTYNKDLQNYNIDHVLKLNNVDYIDRNMYSIYTKGCKMISLDPFDEHVKTFISKPSAVHCKNSVAPLVDSNFTALIVNKSAFDFYNISDKNLMQCYYQPFWRKNPVGGEPDQLTRYGDRVLFNNDVIIREEFVNVTCKYNESVIYKDYFVFMPDKTNKTKKDGVNVVFVGLDAISRINLYRQMPETVKLLHRMGAVELFGYNKVADNTFPNLMPMFTGSLVEELSCWKQGQKFDKCLFIWDEYSKADFLTVYAEDSSNIGTFHFNKKGFTQQPTDYYWRTFDYEAEANIGNVWSANAYICIGPRPVYQVMLDYSLKLFQKNVNYWGFFFSGTMSHDYLNSPALCDTSFVNYFERLRNSDLLNNTVLFFISDHGIRWGPIRQTHQGYLEERLPFLFALFPEQFRQKYPLAVQNFRNNADRLTTPLDIHETLRDLLSLDISDRRIKEREGEIYKRQISLFLPILPSRTCESSGILPHWCACQNQVDEDVNSSQVNAIASYLVNQINNLLKNYTTCSRLQLKQIVSATLAKSKNDNIKHAILDYTVAIVVEPNGAIFEGSVRCVNCTSQDSFKLTGPISRLNEYRNTSSCVSDSTLKLYCYCKKG